MKHLFIEPNDVLLFRDGRPFSRGVDHLAVGLFPPAPSALYGAVRSAMLSQNGADFGQTDFGLDAEILRETGTRTETGTLAVRHFANRIQSGPCTPSNTTGTLAVRHFALACRERNSAAFSRFYPTPGDLLVCKADRSKDSVHCAKQDARIAHLRPRGYPISVRGNAPLGLAPLWADHSEGEVFEPLGGFLREAAFAAYLGGELPPGTAPDCVGADALFRTEARTSVEIGPKGTAEEGHLFTVQFTRLAPGAGLALTLENADALAAGGWLRLGGEARSAIYTDAAPPQLSAEAIQPRVEQTRRFRLVLTTPAVWEHGWRPDGIGDDGRGELGGCAVRLRGATAGYFQHIGGWDMAAGCPKPTRRAVPAGAVYFFELESGDNVAALFDACFGRALSHNDEDRKQGLGITYIGTW